MADSAIDSPVGPSIETPVECPRCGAKVTKGSATCPNGHVLRRETAIARRVEEAVMFRPHLFKQDLHPRDRTGRWRRSFVVRSQRGKVAGEVQQHSVSGDYRGFARTEPAGPLPGRFTSPVDAEGAVMTHHYTHAFDEERFDSKTMASPEIPTIAHDVSYTPSTGRNSPDIGGSMTDTPQQKMALRTNSAARKVRARFPAGTRVEGAPGVFGTVTRHVPGTNAQGGTLVVRWDSGTVGRHGAISLKVADVQQSLSARRAEASARAADDHEAQVASAVATTVVPNVRGSLNGVDLTHVAPKSIDQELGRIWLEQQTVKGYLQQVMKRIARDQATGRTRTDRFAEHDDQSLLRYRADLAKLNAEAAPLENEYTRRGGWSRYYLVTNGNGHVHKTLHCPTTYRTTQFAWLPDLAAQSEHTMVGEFGEKACSVCFPSAPSMYEAMKAAGTLSTVARKDQAERAARDALKAKRQAEKDAKAITNPDGSELKLSGRYGDRIGSLVTARNTLVSELANIDRLNHEPSSGPRSEHQMGMIPEHQLNVEILLRAISAKTGEDSEALRATATAKAVKKQAKEGYW